MIVPVVADADTLFGAATRGLLVHLDYQGLIRLHWSPLILDELSRALVDTKRKATMADAKAHEARLRDALPNATVDTADVQRQFTAVHRAVASAKDMHVAACARHLVAQRAYPGASPVALVTRNIRDFDGPALLALGITLHEPDDFLFELQQAVPRKFTMALRTFHASLRSKPTAQAMLAALRRDGLARTVSTLAANISVP